MRELVIPIYPANQAAPVANDFYLAYMVGKDHACFLEYEDGQWYKDGVSIDKKTVAAWGICPKVVQGGSR